MRKGLIFGLLVVVVAIAAIAALLYRPATVIGTSGKSLAYSVRSEAGADKTGVCSGGGDKFVCTAFDSSGNAQTAYGISVDDYGCWDGKRREAGGGDLPDSLAGCITIVDLVRRGD